MFSVLFSEFYRRILCDLWYSFLCRDGFFFGSLGSYPFCVRFNLNNFNITTDRPFSFSCHPLRQRVIFVGMWNWFLFFRFLFPFRCSPDEFAFILFFEGGACGNPVVLFCCLYVVNQFCRVLLRNLFL